MACDDRQLTQAQLEAGFAQQRTGAGQALRPFSGSPTAENLIDYINRELVPVLRATRNAANDVWKQVVDNAPSANPLAFYFSTTTANADPTAGRVRLNQAVQNTATVIRVSESNGRLQSVQPWLDVMSGGPTSPLGTVTILDAINPGRFLRFDLNSMTDQGSYWDLGVTFIEGSDDSPFVDDEAVTIGFIAGVSAAGSTVPVGSLSPVAPDTFIGNIGTTTAAPGAVPLADVDSTSVVYDATSHTFQRAALTGFATATQNSNATSSAEPIVTFSASANMSNERVLTSSTSNTVSTAVAGQIALQRAALTGAIAASADANATLFAGIRDNNAAENDRTNLNFVSGDSNTAVVTDDAVNDELEVTFNYTGTTSNINVTSVSGSQGTIDISTLKCGGVYSVQSQTGAASADGFTAKTDGFWFTFDMRDAGPTGTFDFADNVGNTSTSVRTPLGKTIRLDGSETVLFVYSNTRWRMVVGQAKVDAITASYDAASSVTNSTSPITLASLTIPANSVAAGACFEFFGAVNWTRSGTTATSVKLSLKINGTIVALYQTATATSGSIPGDASIHGFFNFLAVGASGSVKGHLAPSEFAPFGTTSATTFITASGVDTTSDVTVAVTAEMTVATNQLSIQGNSGLVQKRASTGSVW